MARILLPDPSGLGEHVDWSLHRPEMATGMGQLSAAVYGNSRLPLREREAARWIIALINHCEVCQDTRVAAADAHQVDDDFYGAVAAWATSEGLSVREKLAAEFAQLFALDHQAMDDAFWERLRGAYDDDEVADLLICCGMFLGLGRAMAVVGVPAPPNRILL